MDVLMSLFSFAGSMYAFIFLMLIAFSDYPGAAFSQNWYHLFLGGSVAIFGLWYNIKNEKKTEDGRSYSDALEDKMHDFLSDTISSQKETTSSADEIKKYKDLYDSGAITKEEYEKKKNDLLDL